MSLDSTLPNLGHPDERKNTQRTDNQRHLADENRCWTLGRQISAIWPQINADDQLIILANGCTDYTTQIVSKNSDWLSDFFLVRRAARRVRCLQHGSEHGQV